jgi:hypothetical protein
MAQVFRDTLVALYVRDTLKWRAEGRRPPATDWRSPIYATPLATLHRAVGAPQGNYQLDLSTVPVVWRLFRAGKRRGALHASPYPAEDGDTLDAPGLRGSASRP